MDPNDGKDIGELYRERFKDHEGDLSPNAFENIMMKLPVEEKPVGKPFALNKFFLGVMTGFFISSALFVTYLVLPLRDESVLQGERETKKSLGKIVIPARLNAGGAQHLLPNEIAGSELRNVDEMEDASVRRETPNKYLLASNDNLSRLEQLGYDDEDQQNEGVAVRRTLLFSASADRVTKNEQVAESDIQAQQTKELRSEEGTQTVMDRNSARRFDQSEEQHKSIPDSGSAQKGNKNGITERHLVAISESLDQREIPSSNKQKETEDGIAGESYRKGESDKLRGTGSMNSQMKVVKQNDSSLESIAAQKESISSTEKQAKANDGITKGADEGQIASSQGNKRWLASSAKSSEDQNLDSKKESDSANKQAKENVVEENLNGRTVSQQRAGIGSNTPEKNQAYQNNLYLDSASEKREAQTGLIAEKERELSSNENNKNAKAPDSLKLEQAVVEEKKEAKETKEASRVIQKLNETPIGRWSIGVYFSPESSFRKLVSTDKSVYAVSERNANESPKVSYSGGISVQYMLSKNFFIGSGLSYISIGEKGKYFTNSQTTSQEYTNTYNYLGVPVLAGLKLGQNKWSVSASTGLILNFLLKANPNADAEKYYTTYQEEKELEEEQGGSDNNNTDNNDNSDDRQDNSDSDSNDNTEDSKTLTAEQSSLEFNRLALVYFGGLELNYQLYQRLSIGVGPSFKYFLSSIYTKDDVQKAKPYSLGVQIGLKYTF